MNASELVVDAAITITVAELVVLTFGRRLARTATEGLALLANASAGLFLMLAVRAALVGSSWPWLAMCFAGAGTAHVTDLVLRRSRQRTERSH